jgi:hypothetical protein
MIKTGKADAATLMPEGLAGIRRVIRISSVQSAKELLTFIVTLLTILKYFLLIIDN